MPMTPGPLLPTTGVVRQFQPASGLATSFKIYEPFGRTTPGGRRHLVLYAHRTDGTRKRIGSMDLGLEDADAFVQLWRSAGGGFATSEDLGLPPSMEHGSAND